MKKKIKISWYEEIYNFIFFQKSSELENYFERFKRKLKFEIRNNQNIRKNNNDLIRKKIKAHFFKQIRKNLNKRLKAIKYKKIFDFFPQDMIINMSKENNKKIFQMKLKEVILYHYYNTIKHINEYTSNPLDKSIINNKKLIEELEKKENEEFYNILVIKYVLQKTLKELFKEYLNSSSFKESIDGLFNKGYYFEYIKKYIKLAKDFINYYKLD